MMAIRTGELLEGLPVFLAVVEAKSFTAAAKRLGVSPSAASQAVRALEARIGTPLLARSTRALRLTAAGEEFFDGVAPAFATLEDATRAVAGRAGRPSGLLRLTMTKAAYDGVVAPALRPFAERFPDVRFEIEIDGELVDLAERGLDAGFRYGHLLARDVDSMEVLPGARGILTASPGYLAARGMPNSVTELAGHDAVVCRSRTTGVLTPWLLACGAEVFRLDHPAPTVAGDLATTIDLTVRGFGLNCSPTQCVAPMLARGELRRVLPEWAAVLEPIHVYYPKRRARSAALKAFIRHLQEASSS